MPLITKGHQFQDFSENLFGLFEKSYIIVA